MGNAELLCGVRAMTYRVNEIFYSLQGEGVRSGSPNVFVRFSGCNQTCRKESHGFDCDTEFASGITMEAEAIVDEAKALSANCNWVILTGGEPGLQVDKHLIHFLHSRGYRIAIETNGSIELPSGLDWITVSPKVAEHALRQLKANEAKYVRGYSRCSPTRSYSARTCSSAWRVRVFQ
jgi:7-carboxy-7-deazaguanine synthase